MKFKHIFVILALIGFLVIPIFGQSFAQVTWNIFKEKDGLFSVEVPSNWNASEVPEAEKLAPIDYVLRYNDKGNSFAWVELLINEPLYSNASAAAESYMSQYQQFDDFKLLEPIDCNTYTLNNESACSFLSSQQLEGEQRRNVLDLVSISPEGIQTDVILVASSNIYKPFLPVTKNLIGSLSINSTAVSKALENQTIENIESEIPLIPTENDTAQQQAEIPAVRTGNASSSSQPFRSIFDSFVTSEPLGFGIYDTKTSNTFRPGEDIILYIEPAGFEYGTEVDNSNDTVYTIDFTADFAISDTEGNLLSKQQRIPIGEIVSHFQNKEVFIPFTITQTNPFPPGNYIITYSIHNENSGKSFDIVKDIVISETKMA